MHDRREQRLFRVWCVDDILHSFFAMHMDWLFGEPGHIVWSRSMPTATEAIKALVEARHSWELPHVALVDIHFKKEQEDDAYVRPTHPDWSSVVAEQEALDDREYGVMVASELRAAERRLRDRSVDLVLFTGNTNVRRNLGWIAAPTPQSQWALVPIRCKGVASGDDPIVYDWLEERLRAAARDRIALEGLPHELMDGVMRLAAWTQQFDGYLPQQLDMELRAMWQERDRVAETMARLQAFNHRLLYQPEELRAEFSSAGILNVLSSMEVDVDLKAEDIRGPVCRLRQAVSDLDSTADRVRGALHAQPDFTDEYERVHSVLVENHVEEYFPLLAAAMAHAEKGELECYTGWLWSAARDALEDLAGADYNWTLARALKSVKLREPDKPSATTLLAAVLHEEHESYRKRIGQASTDLPDLSSWLRTASSLPPDTQARIRQDADRQLRAEDSARCGESPDRAAERVAALGIPPPDRNPLHAFHRFYRSGSRPGWESTFAIEVEQMKQALAEAGRSAIGRGSLSEVPMLTDWRRFFLLSTEQTDRSGDGLIAWLCQEFYDGSPYIETEEQDDGRVLVLRFRAFTEARIQLNQGGLATRLKDFQGWGRSVVYRVGDQEGSVEHILWPTGLEPRSCPAFDRPTFELEWTVDNWLRTRTNEGRGRI